MEQTRASNQTIEATGFVIQPRLAFEYLIDKMIYQHFLEQANYKQSNCDRGQLITSVQGLANEAGWTYGKVRYAIQRIKEKGYIEIETLKQNKGLLVTICDYEGIQNLEKYTLENNKRDNKPSNKQSNKQDNKRGESPDTTESGGGASSNDDDNKRNNKPNNKQNNKRNNNALTEGLNSTNSNNIKTYKDLRRRYDETFPQIRSVEEMETFVEQLTLIDDLFAHLNRKLLVKYFEALRFRRSTCKISTNILINLAEKIAKYDKDIITFALYKHILDHDDKDEKYTLGIMRRTDTVEARRNLMKITNRRSEEVKHERIQEHSGHEQYEYGF